MFNQSQTSIDVVTDTKKNITLENSTSNENVSKIMRILDQPAKDIRLA